MNIYLGNIQFNQDKTSFVLFSVIAIVIFTIDVCRSLNSQFKFLTFISNLFITLSFVSLIGSILIITYFYFDENTTITFYETITELSIIYGVSSFLTLFTTGKIIQILIYIADKVTPKEIKL